MRVNWIKGAPAVARRYLVASEGRQEVAIARFKPRSKEWVFPSAAMAFNVTHWQEVPEPPQRELHAPEKP